MVPETTQTFDKHFDTSSSTLMNEDKTEGTITKQIENQTAKIPSGVFLGLAVGSMAVSLGLALINEKKGWANFVGQWAPAFLIMGLYNKIVKTHGSDQKDEGSTYHH